MAKIIASWNVRTNVEAILRLNWSRFIGKPLSRELFTVEVLKVFRFGPFLWSFPSVLRQSSSQNCLKRSEKRSETLGGWSLYVRKFAFKFQNTKNHCNVFTWKTQKSTLSNHWPLIPLGQKIGQNMLSRAGKLAFC